MVRVTRVPVACTPLMVCMARVSVTVLGSGRGVRVAASGLLPDPRPCWNGRAAGLPFGAGRASGGVGAIAGSAALVEWTASGIAVVAGTGTDGLFPHGFGLGIEGAPHTGHWIVDVDDGGEGRRDADLTLEGGFRAHTAGTVTSDVGLDVVRNHVTVGQDLLGVSAFDGGIGRAGDGAAHAGHHAKFGAAGAAKATATAAGGWALRKKGGSSAQPNKNQASFHQLTSIEWGGFRYRL